MQSYLGRMMSTAWPRVSNSRLRPKTTSPNPPACATGAHSEATITMNTAVPPPRFLPARSQLRAKARPDDVAFDERFLRKPHRPPQRDGARYQLWLMTSDESGRLCDAL